jgi:hypothetical protein
MHQLDKGIEGAGERLRTIEHWGRVCERKCCTVGQWRYSYKLLPSRFSSLTGIRGRPFPDYGPAFLVRLNQVSLLLTYSLDALVAAHPEVILIENGIVCTREESAGATFF